MTNGGEGLDGMLVQPFKGERQLRTLRERIGILDRPAAPV